MTSRNPKAAQALSDAVRAAAARGDAAPDFFSTRPTAELQQVLRSTLTRPLSELVNRGGVRFDFKERRIFRDSFWKGSFASDSLLGWEERARTALLGGGAETLGQTFAGGSFWKRFDGIKDGTAFGHVVNYELTVLPGNPSVREVAYPDNLRKYFRKGDKILLLNYTNDPYRIVYDTIKVIDGQNAIGVMHLGIFPIGIEFASFVMARNNYPFEKMAIEDLRLLMAHDRARVPGSADVSGNWSGNLVWLPSAAASLANQGNPAVVRVTFGREGVSCRLGERVVPPGAEEAEVLGRLRLVDGKTMVGQWALPGIDGELAKALGGHLDTRDGEPLVNVVLTRE